LRPRFRSPRWFGNSHAQTIVGPLIALPQHHLPYRLEIVATPDGDFLQLQHLPGDPSLPHVLALHGLEGYAQSCCIRQLAAALAPHRWGLTVMEFRGCGGPLNFARRLYHSGETTDLDLIARLLRQRITGKLFAVGHSLGANVLGKWLGETKDAPVDAAALIGPPFDLTATGPYVDRSLGGFYSRLFISSLLPKALAKERQFPGCIDRRGAERARGLVAYDDAVTAPLHGFADVWDYYARSGCGQFLPSVQRPTLVIAAEDDPLIPGTCIPKDVLRRNPALTPLISRQGGHLGFLDQQLRPWAARQVVRFLARHAQ
jgi:hypothetical protein